MSNYQANIIIKNPATPTGPKANGSAPGMWRMNEVAYWIKQGVWPDPSIVSDPYFPYVTLLLSSTSLSNANNNLIADSSGAFSPILRNGNTTQGSFTPYSTNWSNYFPGTVGNYLTAPNNAAFQFGTGDVTIESWIYITGDSVASPDGNRHATICAGIGPTGISNDFWFYVKGSSTTTGTGLILRTYNSGSEVAVFNTTYSFSKNTWYHVALSRSGNNMYLFINGALHASTTYTGAITVGSNPLNIAYAQTGGINYNAPFFGYLSNLRIVKGTAVYTSAFTPPTAPLTTISGTSILTCQSNRFRDASSNNFAITVTGENRATDFGPFSPSSSLTYNQSDITNWSGYFNGNPDGISVAYSSALAIGSTSSWTVEMWFYSTTTAGGIRNIFRTDTGGYSGIAIVQNGTNLYIDCSISGSGWNWSTGAKAININQWYHVALVRNGGTMTAYLNGVNYYSASSVNIYDAGSPYTFGYGYSDFFFGYISNARIVKGSAVYTGNFTPPTSPLTAISGTALLTLQNAAFTDNSVNNSAITRYGTATVSGNSPFNTVGYWSNNFPGSGNYMTMANSSAFNLSGGTYTIEMWINPRGDYGNYNTLVAKRVLGSGTTAWEVYLRISSGVLSFYNGSNYESSTTPTPGVWSHVAAVYDGTNINLYLNGTRVLQSAASNNDVTADIQIGTFTSNDERFIGSMSNLRITKGAALYSGASFTPPTGPLTTTVSSGTVSLLTCQSNRFVDNSVNAATITVAGSPSVQTFNPFYTSAPASNGGSLYFDGSGDWLSTLSSVTLPSGSNFTLEFWLYPIAAFSSNRGLVACGGARFGLITEAGSIYFLSNSTEFDTNTNPIPGAWNHIAMTRTSGTIRIFLNGVQIGTRSSNTDSFTSQQLYIGSDQSNEIIPQSYMSDVRWSYTSFYTSDFTPPTAPLTPNANTTLLLNGMNAGIYDATTINDMETVSGAQVVTTVSKFGGSSVYFNGTGGFLDIPAASSKDSAFGTGDFTVEMWLYFNSVSGSPTIITFNNFGSGDGFFLNVESSAIGVRADGSTPIRASTTVTTGVWYHVAVTRSSGTLRLFQNGVNVGSTTWTTNCTAGLLRIGQPKDTTGATYALSGYMDDLRVTKGYARYTSNFTPPTQAFPTY